MKKFVAVRSDQRCKASLSRGEAKDSKIMFRLLSSLFWDYFPRELQIFYVNILIQFWDYVGGERWGAKVQPMIWDQRDPGWAPWRMHSFYNFLHSPCQLESGWPAQKIGCCPPQGLLGKGSLDFSLLCKERTCSGMHIFPYIHQQWYTHSCK